MKTTSSHLKIGFGIGMIVVAAVVVALVALPAKQSAQLPGSTKLIAQNAILAGLPGGRLYPFTDTTPNRIVSAHIAVTDSTSGDTRHTCAPGFAPPDNIVILVGEAGGQLVSVMNADTNTGIGSESQCVFHVTVRPGENGVPEILTDIVVVNMGENPLSASNTITVTAEVR